MKVVGLILIIILAGCASLGYVTLDDVRNKNRENLSQLVIGMEKSEVLQVMDTETITATEFIGNPYPWTIKNYKISNPYKVEVLKTKKDGQIYEVLFYYTDIKKNDGAITDDELIPLIIKDGKLQGWGWVFFNEILP